MANKIVELPFPDKDLSPNARVHYQQIAKLKKKQKEDSYYLALNTKPKKAETYHLEILFYPPDNRKRDLDNLYASCKAMLDGLALAWGVDDRQFRPITLDFRHKIKSGKVTIRCINTN